MATAASDGASATLTLSEDALKALAQIGESAIEGVMDGSTSVSAAAKSVLSGARSLATGVWDGARDAATGVGHLAESAWSELKSGLASLEDAGGTVIDKIEDGLEEVASTTRATASAAGHYAALALDAVGDVVSDATLGSVSVLAMI